MTLNNVYNVIFTKIKKRDDLNLELTNITYIKNKRTILDNINLNFKGYCNGILGPNGSGKSTLLKIATGIIKPTSGTVKVGFRDLTSITRGDLSKLITYIPQDRENISGFTVFEYVELGRYPYREIFGSTSQNSKVIIDECLNTVGLIDRSEDLVNHLSGGEMQILRIARALAQRTKIILFDEPTSNLDLKNSRKISDIISHLSELGAITLIASHDIRFINQVCDNVALIKSGKLFKLGTPNQVINNKNIIDAYDLSYDFKEFF